MSSVLAIHPARPDAVDGRRRTQMSVMTHMSSRRRADEVQFWVVYLVTFPVFLLSSLVGRLLPGRLLPGRRLGRLGCVGGRSSVIQEAKASAQTCGSFSLMG